MRERIETCHWPDCKLFRILKEYKKHRYCKRHLIQAKICVPTLYDITKREWNAINIKHRIECEKEESFFQNRLFKMEAMGPTMTEREKSIELRRLQLEIFFFDLRAREAIADRIIAKEIRDGLI